MYIIPVLIMKKQTERCVIIPRFHSLAEPKDPDVTHCIAATQNIYPEKYLRAHLRVLYSFSGADNYTTENYALFLSLIHSLTCSKPFPTLPSTGEKWALLSVLSSSIELACTEPLGAPIFPPCSKGKKLGDLAALPANLSCSQVWPWYKHKFS